VAEYGLAHRGYAQTVSFFGEHVFVGDRSYDSDAIFGTSDKEQIIMATGAELVAIALPHVGEEYENVLVPKNNANWHGPWDCAEFASWIVFQGAGILYGCVDDHANPALVEAYTGAWKQDALNLGRRIDVDKAAAIAGAFVLRYPPAPNKMGHIAISDGQGGTVEAKSHAEDVVQDVIDGRRWDTGILVPGVTYDENVAPLVLHPPNKVIRMGANNDPDIVRAIQNALVSNGIDPGPVDGKYGPKTTAAVAAFQKLNHLVADGEVGPKTAAQLGIQL
jgi:N-acetylmuramoyl-L-alanine amidase